VQSGQRVEFSLQNGRQAYLLCVEGNARISGQHGEEYLEQHDAAEVFGPNVFTVSSADAAAPAHVLMVEMAYTGAGRTDL
jgi:redox-sensitive bicupin YhaK (pirin superfamily)